MTRHLNVTLSLLSVLLILSSCTPFVTQDPTFPEEYYKEAPYKKQREIKTIKDAGKEASYMKKEMARLKAKILSLSPYK